MSLHRYRTRRLLLRQFPGMPEVDRCADNHGWSRIDQTARGSRTIEYTWHLGPVVTLHCVDDGVTANAYVFTSGDVSNLAESYLGTVESELNTWSISELIHQVDQSEDPLEHGRAIIRMAIAAPYERDEEVIQRMAIGLRDDDFRVRDMTMWAMSLCSYPEFRPLLQNIAHGDPEEVLRERAQMLLQAFDKAGVGDL